MKRVKKMLCVVMLMMVILSMTGCDLDDVAGIDNEVNAIEGSIKGCTYNCEFYSNDGERFMTVVGEQIDLSANTIKEMTYNSDGGWGYTKTMSSVVTITIDGNQIENCGSTVIFAQDDLKPDAEFTNIDRIDSKADGIGDLTIVAGIVNEYKNFFGKSSVVVIQSQLGDPICAYSGDDVYWEVCQKLPKTTKLMIDGKALYIHRANFQIIDKALLK